MKAVVFRGIGDIQIEQVPDPHIQETTDAIVRITSSAICGTDLHMIRGSMPGIKPGTILGHEGVGIVEEIGVDIRNLNIGDRVVIASTIACGSCSYCRAGYYSQCDIANPNGIRGGTAFFGGPESTGPFQGLQAEKARIPFANVGLVKLPHEINDNQAILLSDIFPTGFFGAELAEIQTGDTVAIFGCGPVGQFAITSALLLNAGRVFAIDNNRSRLEMAREQGAEVIDFNAEDPIETILRLTRGIGVDRAIDAVGVDSVCAHSGPAAEEAREHEKQYQYEIQEVAPVTHPVGANWHPGDAPSQVLTWAVKALAKAGTLSIIGAYPETARFFPIGLAAQKNLTIKTGNCPHRKYIPLLIELIRNGSVDPEQILTQIEPLSSAIEAYKAFDERQPGWIKVELDPTVEHERAFVTVPE
jgi:threonine dehydrogenase-like Zn-dependent dehydrogenase